MITDSNRHIESLELVYWQDSVSIDTEHDTVEYSMKVPSLPNTLQNLSSLTVLSISNSLENTVLPVQYSILNRLVQLEDLTLTGNINLTLDIESSNLILPRLQSIELNSCTLDNTVYDLLVSLNKYSTSLRGILIESVYGTEPRDIDTWITVSTEYRLEDIPVHNNCTVRELPILNMTKLEMLTLDNCYLDTTLPRDISSLSALENITIDRCVMRMNTTDIQIPEGISLICCTVHNVHEKYSKYLNEQGRLLITLLWIVD